MTSRKVNGGQSNSSRDKEIKQGKEPDIGFRKRSPLVGKSPRDIEELFTAVMQSTIDAIVVTNNEGNIIAWNRGANTVFGYREDEVLDKPLTLLMPERFRNDYLKGLVQIASSGEYRAIGKTIGLYGLRKNGIEFPAEISISTWEAEKRTFHIGIVRDITDRRKSEEVLKQSLGKLQKAMEGFVHALADTVDARDPYTAGHQHRVSKIACAIAEEMNLSNETVAGIRMAGEIHDLGKMSIPAEVLMKPGRLLEVEFNYIKIHPQKGYDILKGMEFPWPVARIVLEHHERMDGSGYPNGLSGEDILPEARIVAIADVVEAMASHRPYRPALGIEVALEEIENNSGTLYDSDFASACLRLFREKKFTFNNKDR